MTLTLQTGERDFSVAGEVTRSLNTNLGRMPSSPPAWKTPLLCRKLTTCAFISCFNNGQRAD